MTVNYEIPVIKYTGNGTTVDFAFRWSCGDPNENYVAVDDALKTEGVDYELEDFSLNFGGTIRFYEAPMQGSTVYIYRRTPITQQVDYVEGEPFPADTHEFQMDKDTRILQEIIEAGAAIGGRVDLKGVQYELYVEIENTGGSNAFILPWTTDGLLAGAFIGEVVEFGEEAPLHGDSTLKNDGYIWWILGQPPAAGGDPNIVMSTAPQVIRTLLPDPFSPVAEFRFNALTGNIEYGYDPQQEQVPPGWQIRPGLANIGVGPTEYSVRFEILSGAVTERPDSPIDTWIDVADITTDFVGWFVQDFGGSPQDVQAIFRIAPLDGAGDPIPEQTISRYIYLQVEQT